MRLTIFDVGHGQCALATAQNGEAVLIDCGQSPENRPSDLLPARGIKRLARLFVTNFDQDHVSDLPRLAQTVDLSCAQFHRNRSIDVPSLREVKLEAGPLTGAMTAAIGMHGQYVHAAPAPLPTPGITWEEFWNPYPTFRDTNNLSLVVFLRVANLTAVFPGDLEVAGWRVLLQRADFRAALGTVSIFVASHHGRENGYCAEVFDFCHPLVVVFSDDVIAYESQRMASTYAPYAIGVTFNGDPRKVMTTRQDGTFWWDV